MTRSVPPHRGQMVSDPRWDQFLRDIGAAPEDLARIEFSYSLPD